MVLDASKTNPGRKCKSIARYVQNYPREMQTNSLILAENPQTNKNKSVDFSAFGNGFSCVHLMRYLMRNMPAEPEMWFFLFSKKVAWCGSRTKRFIVPTSENACNDKTVQKYWKRAKHCENLTMVEWLHLFDTNKTNPKAYKQGSTIVGTKTLSLFNKEYFFQFVLLNLSHTNLNSLRHPNHEQLPNQLQWFAAAVHHFPELWTSDDKLKSWLITQGHRQTYITFILSYIASLRDLLYLFRIQVIRNEQLLLLLLSSLTLDSYQLAVSHHIDKAVHSRQQFYTNNTSLNSYE